jgi:RNA polymerase-binding transcription factor DksA
MTDMLNHDHIADFKTKLTAEKAVLEEELSHLGARNPSNPSDWVAAKPEGEEFGADQNDNADVISDMHENNASMNELEGRLNTVIAALGKIDAGTYGVCEVSGHDIELDRLTANPAARTCKEHMKDESTLP